MTISRTGLLTCFYVALWSYAACWVTWAAVSVASVAPSRPLTRLAGSPPATSHEPPRAAPRG